MPAVPDIEGLLQSSEMQVQKTNPLLSLSETSLTLANFKILDTYLARINSHDPEKRNVRFEKGELERILGVVRILQPDLEKRLDNLFQVVTIRDTGKRNGFTKISLFERAVAIKDDDGCWQIDLAASEAAMEYFFYPENLGYLHYGLKNVINLRSRYSYILYLYLEQNRHMHLQWDVPLAELKTLMRCTSQSYNQYKRFNDLILKKCHQELNSKTTCHYDYAPVKQGRTVKAIHFALQSIQVPAQTQNNAENETYAEICKNEFTEESMSQIRQILDDLPFSGEDIQHQKQKYLADMYAIMDTRKPDKSRIGYLKRILKDNFQGYENEKNEKDEIETWIGSENEKQKEPLTEENEKALRAEIAELLNS